MAPRSKVDSKKEDKVPESTSSRRSARIAGSAAPVSEVKEVPASKKVSLGDCTVIFDEVPPLESCCRSFLLESTLFF